MPQKKIHLTIEGMTCNHCRNTVMNTIKEVAGVEKAEVDLANGCADIVFDDSKTNEQMIIDAVNGTGMYKAVQ